MKETHIDTESIKDNTNTTTNATVREVENMICDNNTSDATELSKSSNELSKNNDLDKLSENGDCSQTNDVNEDVQQEKNINIDLSDSDQSHVKDTDTAKEDLNDCLVEKEVAKVDSITRVKFLPEIIPSYESSVTEKETPEPGKKTSVENKLLNFLNNSEDVDNESQNDDLEPQSDDDKSKDSETSAASVKAKRTSSLDSGIDLFISQKHYFYYECNILHFKIAPFYILQN